MRPPERDFSSTEQIWNQLAEKLGRFIRSRVANDQIAADLLQETFLRIHGNLEHLDHSERTAAWVFRIARNLITDHYRKRGHGVNEVASDAEARETSTENLNTLVAGWLPEMIRQLPGRYRQAVALYELQGRSQQDVADELGISLSGAKSRIQRGRKMLKHVLHECCLFELDRFGNIVDFKRNDSIGACHACGDDCG